MICNSLFCDLLYRKKLQDAQWGSRGRWFKSGYSDQKCFTTDFLTKSRKVNEGEVPQYYIEHSHEAIIVPEEWDAVQEELA